ncbi:MAG: nuclear transport factor 2 family protein [bacterium]|nr:nuclear transport factor 2 family protein [bacterium]
MEARGYGDASAAIERSIAIYAQLLDSGRLAEWGELFAEDAVFRVGADRWSGRDAIVAAIGGMQPPPDRPVKHVCLVPVIDLLDETHARAWTDFSAFATGEDGRISIATIGRYYDELRFEGDRWRFSRRAIVMAGEVVPDDLAASPAR